MEYLQWNLQKFFSQNPPTMPKYDRRHKEAPFIEYDAETNNEDQR